MHLVATNSRPRHTVETPSIERVAPESVWWVWPNIESYLGKVLERYPFGGITIEDVRIKCASGQFRLFVILEGHEFLGAVCTRVGEFGKYHVLGIGGRNMDAWGDTLMDVLLDDAAINGCHIFGGYGRKGWSRKLGIEPKRECYEWELDINQQGEIV